MLNPWPENAFGWSGETKVVRDYIDFKLEMNNVPQTFKIHTEKKTLEALKVQGIRNIKRATRYDIITERQEPINKLEFNVRDLEVMRRVLLDGIALECTKGNHDVSINFEKPRVCKKCTKFGHKSKNCMPAELRHCLKCDTEGHDITTCKWKGKPTCAHCKQSHLTGDRKCKVFIQESYKLNQFICDFMVKECGKSCKYGVIGLEPPEDMNDGEDDLIDDEKTNEREEIADYIETYMRNRQQNSVDNELRDIVANLELRIAEHEVRLEDVEEEVAYCLKGLDVVAEKIDDVQQNLNEKMDAQTATFNSRIDKQTANFDAKFNELNAKSNELNAKSNEQFIVSQQMLEMMNTMNTNVLKITKND